MNIELCYGHSKNSNLHTDGPIPNLAIRWQTSSSIILASEESIVEFVAKTGYFCLCEDSDADRPQGLYQMGSDLFADRQEGSRFVRAHVLEVQDLGS